MTLLLCAALAATDQTVRATDTQDASSAGNNSVQSPSGEQLLAHQASKLPVEADWVLQDNRQSMPESISFAPSQDVAIAPLSSMTSPKLPHVDTAAISEPANDVNDLLVPVPVLHLGWALVLSVGLFHVGHRMLKIRRTA